MDPRDQATEDGRHRTFAWLNEALAPLGWALKNVRPAPGLQIAYRIERAADGRAVDLVRSVEQIVHGDGLDEMVAAACHDFSVEPPPGSSTLRLLLTRLAKDTNAKHPVAIE
jgi:hypothetical protein